MSATKALPVDVAWILDLNDACCFRGRGKIFVLTPNYDNPSKDEINFCGAAVAAFKKVPRFFYCPTAIGDEERATWAAWSEDHELKWAARTSRQVGFPRYAPVLPFDLSIGHAEPRIDLSKGAPLTVCVAPGLKSAVVGLTHSLKVVCSIESGLIRTAPGGWSSLAQWTRYGAHESVHALDTLYTENRDLHLFYGSLVDKLIAAGDEAAEAGQEYGIVPETTQELKKEKAQKARQWRVQNWKQKHKDSG